MRSMSGKGACRGRDPPPAPLGGRERSSGDGRPDVADAALASTCSRLQVGLLSLAH